jgi:adenylosuccinate lyase
MSNDYEWRSPFENRYKNDQLSDIWGRINTVRLWHHYWYMRLDDLVPEQSIDIDESSTSIARCIARADELEKTTHHDLVAALLAFTERLPEDVRPFVHLGLTSSDPEDYADLIRIHSSIEVILGLLQDLIAGLTATVLLTGDIPIMGRTHLQLAEPTLLGYRLAVTLDQLVDVGRDLRRTRTNRALHKAQTGAVGTCSNLEMVGVASPLSEMLAAGQTYPRSYDLDFAYAFARIAAILHKLALDMRIMYMEDWVVKKPAGVGSSAMPGKVNPIGWEKICSLARMIPNKVNNLWDVAANSALERTLDDSACRRIELPELFFTMAEILTTAHNEIGKFPALVDRDRAMGQIAAEWRSWLPSRALAWRQKNIPGLDRLKAHQELALLANDPDDIFMAARPGAFWYMATGRPMDDIEDMLYLGMAVNMTGMVVQKAETYLLPEDSDE